MMTSIPQPTSAIGRFLARRFHVTRQGAFLFLVMWAIFSTAHPTRASLLIGGLFAVAGEVLRIVTSGYGYKVGEISRRGPYRFVRHPYFLGTALLLVGLVMAGRNSWVMACTLTGIALVLREDIRDDERRYQRAFGPSYDLYKAQVPAIVPRLWGVSKTKDDQRHFSLEWAIFKGRHREIDALLGLLAAFAYCYVLTRVASPTLFHAAAFAIGVLLVIGRMIYVAVRRPVRLYTNPVSSPGD